MMGQEDFCIGAIISLLGLPKFPLRHVSLDWIDILSLPLHMVILQSMCALVSLYFLIFFSYKGSSEIALGCTLMTSF